MRTIVIVMMENRSFDHILGYLSLPQFGHPKSARIDGVAQAQLLYAHDTYRPTPLVSSSLSPDPPHERSDIAVQIDDPLAGSMKGFITSYKRVFDANAPGARLSGVMEYCTPRNIPVTDLLARNFTICDSWHAPLPASTLPNRFVLMSGYALVNQTPADYLQIGEDLFFNH